MYGVFAFNLGGTYGHRLATNRAYCFAGHQRPGSYYPVSLHDLCAVVLGYERTDVRAHCYGGVFRGGDIRPITLEGKET